MIGTMDTQELVKRLGGLAFAAVYTVKHGVPRDAALRIAEHAYRFLDGEDAEVINFEADNANAFREARSRKNNRRVITSLRGYAAKTSELLKKARTHHGG